MRCEPESQITIRVFCDTGITDQDKLHIARGVRQTLPTASVVFNKSGWCDLAVVINFDPGFHWAVVDTAQIVKWLAEPVISGNLSRRFSVKHSRIFSKIFTSNLTGDSREELTPPLVPPKVSRDYSNEVINKTRKISVISSTLRDLAGHRNRDDFVRYLETNAPEIEVFGKGRANELAQKENGLLPYMFSVAIENSADGDYWTEKLSDCFMTLTVPLYYGSRNIVDYFPQKSFIWLPINHPEEALQIIAQLNENEYLNRVDALREAAKLVTETYNLGTKLANYYLTMKSEQSIRKPRLFISFTIDSLIHICLRTLSNIGFTGLLSKLFHWNEKT